MKARHENSILIEPHYLPSLEFFVSVVACENLILEIHGHYEKQSYRNRCYLNTDKGAQLLTVPIINQTGKVALKCIRVDYRSRWQNIHWRTIQSAYSKAPFFEHYSEPLKKIIFEGYEFLIDLNKHILSFCLKSIKVNLMLAETVSYQTEVENGILDLRSSLDAKKRDNNSTIYNPVPYGQVFGNAFVKNLSLIDLLFCAGPDSLRILKASQKVDLNK
jgi:hypothetical protein